MKSLFGFGTFTQVPMEWRSICVPARKPAYTSTRCQRYGRKTRLKFRHTSESERNASLRAMCVVEGAESVRGSDGKWDTISSNSSFGRVDMFQGHVVTSG